MKQKKVMLNGENNMLTVNAIFESISGETGAFEQGSWCTFIRLQGCNHKCDYCDIPQAQNPESKSSQMKIKDIVKQCHTKKVLITGGEPLLQTETEHLIKELLLSNHKVQIETNGDILPLPFPHFDEVTWVVDIKTPCSGEQNKQKLPPTKFANYFFDTTTPIYFKFVINSKDDIIYSIPYINELMKIDSYNTMKFAFSPLFDTEGNVNYNLFHEVINLLDNKILDKTICSLQIHKLIQID